MSADPFEVPEELRLFQQPRQIVIDRSLSELNIVIDWPEGRKTYSLRNFIEKMVELGILEEMKKE